MKCKNMTIFISLLFILLTISCVSATQEVDIEDTFVADDTVINEVSYNGELQENAINSENVLSEVNSSEFQLKEYVSNNDILAASSIEIPSLGATGSISTKLITPNRVIYVSEAIDGYKYQIILKDSNGIALSGKKVSFDFNNQTLTAKTDKTGWATVKLIANQSGIYNVGVTFEGDNKYAAVSQNSTVKLLKERTKFVAPDRVLYSRDISKGFMYSVILKTKDGVALPNKKVLLNIGGHKQVLFTDENGYAHFNITTDTPGFYIIELKFAGTITCYENVSENRNFNIITIPTAIIAPNRVLSIYDMVDSYVYSAILKDKDKNPLANKKITVNINGNKFTGKTDKTGWADIKIITAKEGLNDLEITFEGDKYYREVTEHRSIKLLDVGNPYGKKAKKVWINADIGSDDMKNAVARLLRQNGWTVHVGETDSNAHYKDYFSVTKDYQAYITLYNGFCAGTIREAYSSFIQKTLDKKDVTLVVMWDTRNWVNPDGMGPYRYGDFTGYDAARAWDDNFSVNDPAIDNVAVWLKKNNAVYCAYPSADGLVAQFLSGGYFAMHHGM